MAMWLPSFFFSQLWTKKEDRDIRCIINFISTSNATDFDCEPVVKDWKSEFPWFELPEFTAMGPFSPKHLSLSLLPWECVCQTQVYLTNIQVEHHRSKDSLGENCGCSRVITPLFLTTSLLQIKFSCRCFEIEKQMFSYCYIKFAC